MKNIFILIFLFFNISFYTQNLVKINRHSDCDRALFISTDNIFGPTNAPEDFGEILEFDKNPKNSIHYFEKEHHSVWYKFETQKTGEFIFEISPSNLKDDYDFLIFKYTDSSFCKNVILKKMMLPERSNISRNKISNDGKTGLSFSSKNEWVASGIGETHSKFMNVKAGEIYYIVIDSYKKPNEGHKISFNYKVDISFEGKIMSKKSKKGLKAEINIENIKGEVLFKIETDKEGNFNKKLDENFSEKEVNFSIFSDSYVFKDTLVSIENMTEEKIYLEKLKKGEKFTLNNINFYGGTPDILPTCESSLLKLLKFMNANKNLKIQIEGHTHKSRTSSSIHKKLSKKRAENIKKFLVKHKIKKDRISTIGYGFSKMLYPKAITEKEKLKNRRVEIKILKY